MSRMNLLWRMVYVAHDHGHMLHNPPLEVGYVTYGQRHTWHNPPRGGLCDVWPSHKLHNPQVFICMCHAWIYFAAFLVRDKPWKKWKMNKYIPLSRANISIRNKDKQMQCMSRLGDFMRDKQRLFCHSCPMRHIAHVTSLLFSCSANIRASCQKTLLKKTCEC